MGCVASRRSHRVSAEPHDAYSPTVLRKAGYSTRSFLSEAERHQNSLLEAAEADGRLYGSLDGESSPRNMARMLVLGAGAVGKTTLVRCLAQRHDGGNYGAPEAVIIGAHLIFLLREVLNAMRQFDLCIENAELSARAHEMTRSQLYDAHGDLVRYAADLARITSDISVAQVLDRAEEMGLSSHARWFFSQQGRILSPDYVPSIDDLLRLRVRTTGVARQPYQILGRQVEVLDFGGMRAERVKWSKFLLETDCVLFVASLSEWSQQLSEDRSINRMSESISTYEKMCNELCESDVPICVFLTNVDLLRIQLKNDPTLALSKISLIIGAEIECGGGEPATRTEATHAKMLPHELQASVIDAIRRRYERVRKPSLTFVVDASSVDATSEALHEAIMLALLTFARSGRGHEAHTSGESLSSSTAFYTTSDSTSDH